MLCLDSLVRVMAEEVRQQSHQQPLREEPIGSRRLLAPQESVFVERADAASRIQI